RARRAWSSQCPSAPRTRWTRSNPKPTGSCASNARSTSAPSACGTTTSARRATTRSWTSSPHPGIDGWRARCAPHAARARQARLAQARARRAVRLGLRTPPRGGRGAVREALLRRVLLPDARRRLPAWLDAPRALQDVPARAHEGQGRPPRALPRGRRLPARAARARPQGRSVPRPRDRVRGLGEGRERGRQQRGDPLDGRLRRGRLQGHDALAPPEDALALAALRTLDDGERLADAV